MTVLPCLSSSSHSPSSFVDVPRGMSPRASASGYCLASIRERGSCIPFIYLKAGMLIRVSACTQLSENAPMRVGMLKHVCIALCGSI